MLAMAKLIEKELKKIDGGEMLLDKLGYDTPPFDPFQIAEDLGIEVDSRSVTMEKINRSYSGSISKVGGKIQIWVNPFDAEVRRRFTVAHELGHYINGDLKEGKDIFDTPDTLYRSDGKSDSREVKANKFAAELLVPEKHIYEQAKNITNNAENESVRADIFIKEMAKRFNVSKSAMLIRLINLRIVPPAPQS